MPEEKEGRESKGRRQAEEIDEILQVVQERIPKLVSGIVDSVLPRAQDLGKEAASFYKELRAAGMSDQDAFKLTRELIHSYDRTSVLDTLLGKFVNVGFQPQGERVTVRSVDRKKVLEDAEALRKELEAAQITAANAEELKGKIQKWYRGLRTITGHPVYQEVANDLTASWDKGDQARIAAIKRSIAKLAEFQATLATASK